MASDVAQSLLRALPRVTRGHHQQVVAQPQTCRAMRHEWLLVPHDQRHRGTLGEAELADLDARDLRTASNPHLRIFHDDDTKVYLNGTLIAELPGANAAYAFVPLTAAARAALRSGRNTLAVHTHQTRGGQFIDVGIVDVVER